jgi:hypothetical protein
VRIHGSSVRILEERIRVQRLTRVLKRLTIEAGALFLEANRLLGNSGQQFCLGFVASLIGYLVGNIFGVLGFR